MSIAIEELNGANCKTYLLSVGDRAILVDPVRERVPAYLQELQARGLSLERVLETHLHADHLMAGRADKRALGAEIVMHQASPSPLVDRHVDDGDRIELGGETIVVMHTPGHTPDSVCYLLPGAVLTGDTLLIGGSGRTDFPGGDAGAQYDAVTGRLFTLPDETLVYPAHDYNGKARSTIGDERLHNPRFLGKSRDDYIALMGSLGLPFPARVQEALQVNQSGFEAEELHFPSVAEIARAASVDAPGLAAELGKSASPLVIDVREPEEFVGELGHIAGALPVPLDLLEHRLPKLAGYVDQRIVLVCRAGARSATACALLSRAGFRRVANLSGGMLAWHAAGLPVQR